MPTCNRCNGKGTIQPFAAIAPSRCPVCLGLKTIAMKRPYKEYPKGEGVWLHINHHEGVSYMEDKPLNNKQLYRLLDRIENDRTAEEAASDSGHRGQRADTQDVDADPNDSD